MKSIVVMAVVWSLACISCMFTQTYPQLLAARARYGVQTASSIGPDCPVTADAADSERITLTRRELEALVDEAVQKERSRR